MLTINRASSATYTRDNSTFIAHLVPIARYEQSLESLRNEHKKAAHFVRATRILNAHKQIVESSSDDGEPKGSSGVPVLNVLRGKGLVDCGVVVVRYFGGRLLGVGGLVRAYTNATLAAVEGAELVAFEAVECYVCEVAFAQINHAKYCAAKLGISDVSVEILPNCARIALCGSAQKISDFQKMLGGVH